ncbi:hypothetical protein ACJZ2D_012382 [Fusarium nematophilum]
MLFSTAKKLLNIDELTCARSCRAKRPASWRFFLSARKWDWGHRAAGSIISISLFTDQAKAPESQSGPRVPRVLVTLPYHPHNTNPIRGGSESIPALQRSSAVFFLICCFELAAPEPEQAFIYDNEPPEHRKRARCGYTLSHLEKDKTGELLSLLDLERHGGLKTRRWPDDCGNMNVRLFVGSDWAFRTCTTTFFLPYHYTASMLVFSVVKGPESRYSGGSKMPPISLLRHRRPNFSSQGAVAEWLSR